MSTFARIVHSWSNGINCTPPAIEDFPHDLFDEAQRQGGAVVVHVIVSLYLFIALAVVCDKFFVPAVEKICHALSMSKDVAGATFMAAATSAPELFVNAIGTFITEGDIGVGTIVGSAVFNILAVPACCGIGAGMVVPLDWWPVSRDCLAYGVTVAILICIIHDERVEWYEALTLVLLYIVYIAVMYWDKSFQRCTRFRTNNDQFSSTDCHIATDADEIHLPRPDKLQSSGDRVEQIATIDVPLQNGGTKAQEENPEPNYEYELLVWPARGGWIRKTAWIMTWPIHLIFMCTIPDCEKPRFKNWFPVTFLMCIIWIGSLSYVVAWMITIIGDTLKIPDSVMGITFLAAGTSVPEAVSSVIVAKQGHGSMGISNSIGSNTFDILLCLGLPWLIKSSFSPTQPGRHYISINSGGLEYSAISLLSTLMLLYIAFASNKFQLDRKVGRACLCMYAVFLILASLIELNVFFMVNLPTCQRTVK
uniref:sodium/potassium/calcium exchanger 3 isoform X1 n=1 Tax=Vespula vulgaris TaxID=7454 RepID=UPI00212DC348|nr:sodium/potassium/calcium exchanger 3 isoform X1 [Vespula vulgaris]XP_050850466.1 sodium/potassium/calcium exchanger 3 isoform X1 [Vespula vulgaris]XP_050850467.1 sodium/potassium/calcium exchanger 3 isoform X1 [Vespula vulgaris]XP_050850468.1 sodium/potassium/calcium exchanger 3 isoform X1 [Vespula vulgaris]XP_050850469.1 sodium/potassium/calcium exchanger 3 isoform X1 [Vespula vulgaris]XP_050850470.1 sodium/potassium/calcium exchanger 3 isoform X1 [Vespula vulgaris]XP_050850471.1 sodium/p